MIDAATRLVADQLNQHLRRIVGHNEDVVVVSNILEQDGTVTPLASNKLVVFLVNIEKDTGAIRNPAVDRAGTGAAVVGYPPVYLNLYLMIAGHFGGEQYVEALKLISHAISFFQGHPVFDRRNTPELDARIEKLVLEMENVNLSDLGTLWTSLGGRYLPSVLYKVRMVAFDSEAVRARVPRSKEVRQTTSS